MKIPKIKQSCVFVVFLLLLDCALGGYIGFWREFFWEYVSNKNLYGFSIKLLQFSAVALTSCYISGKSQFLVTYISLVLRRGLTRVALTKYPRQNREFEGIQQRIQEDCYSYPLLGIQLAVGLIRSIITLGVFLYIVVVQLGVYYILIPIGYTLIGTLLAGKLAFPLLRLNYVNQVLEAKFRQTLEKLDYARAHLNNYELARMTKRLTYFQSFYNQIRVIVPHMMLFPVYFASKITFGVYMQCSSSIAEIIDNLSYLINVFGDINRWLSCRKRLKELEIIT